MPRCQACKNDDFEDDYEYDDEGAYAAENYYDGEFEDGSQDEELEALANFMSAKKKLAQARQSSQRGFAGRGSAGRGSSVGSSSSKGSGKGRGGAGAETLAAKKAKSRCADCGQYGHWHGDPECSKAGAAPKPRPVGAHLAGMAEVYAPRDEPSTPYPDLDDDEREYQDARSSPTSPTPAEQSPAARAERRAASPAAQPTRVATTPKAKAASKAAAKADSKAASKAASATAAAGSEPYLGPGAKPPTAE